MNEYSICIIYKQKNRRRRIGRREDGTEEEKERKG